MTGIVKWFNIGSNYGFILPDGGGGDVWFSLKDVAEKRIEAGDIMEFDVVKESKGPRAVRIHILKRANPNA